MEKIEKLKQMKLSVAEIISTDKKTTYVFNIIR